jgi:hypothetical protein
MINPSNFDNLQLDLSTLQNAITLFESYSDTLSMPSSFKAELTFGHFVNSSTSAKEQIQIISNALYNNDYLTLNHSSQEKINRSVQNCYSGIIESLNSYSGESLTRPQFNKQTQDEAVSSLGINITPLIAANDLKKSEEAVTRIIRKLQSCTEENNKIDWELVSRIIDSFNQIQTLHSTLADRIPQRTPDSAAADTSDNGWDS